MTWTCHRDHLLPSTDSYRMTRGPREWPTFAGWAMCQVIHLGLVKFLVLKVGVLDCDEEGGVLYWRWDWWNAKERGRWLAYQRKEWERKRADAISRWGEGAG